MPDHHLVLASPALALAGLRAAIRSLEATGTAADPAFTLQRACLLPQGWPPGATGLMALDEVLRAARS